MLKVFVDLAGTRRLAKPVKWNTHTCWVQVMMGCNTPLVIKRHIRKNNVLIYVRGDNETIHTTTGHQAILAQALDV
jgi:hypothetical protein